MLWLDIFIYTILFGSIVIGFICVYKAIKPSRKMDAVSSIKPIKLGSNDNDSELTTWIRQSSINHPGIGNEGVKHKWIPRGKDWHKYTNTSGGISCPHCMSQLIKPAGYSDRMECQKCGAIFSR